MPSASTVGNKKMKMKMKIKMKRRRKKRKKDKYAGGAQTSLGAHRNTDQMWCSTHTRKHSMYIHKISLRLKTKETQSINRSMNQSCGRGISGGCVLRIGRQFDVFGGRRRGRVVHGFLDLLEARQT